MSVQCCSMFGFVHRECKNKKETELTTILYHRISNPCTSTTFAMDMTHMMN